MNMIDITPKLWNAPKNLTRFTLPTLKGETFHAVMRKVAGDFVREKLPSVPDVRVEVSLPSDFVHVHEGKTRATFKLNLRAFVLNEFGDEMPYTGASCEFIAPYGVNVIDTLAGIEYVNRFEGARPKSNAAAVLDLPPRLTDS